MAKPILTPRQQEAQKLYSKTMQSAFWMGFLVFIAVEIAVLTLFLLLLPPVSRFPGWLFAPLLSLIWLFAHTRALNAVRCAGLLDEEREIVARTATTFAGENMAFQYPSSPLGKLALIAGAMALTALMWCLWHYWADDFTSRAMGAFGFALFSCATLLTIATMNRSNASLDERGVFAYRFSLLPTLVGWNEIESAILHRVSNFYNGADSFTVTLKSADDKTLLVLNPNTFMGSSPQWQQQFIAEIKRRLRAATPPLGQENCGD